VNDSWLENCHFILPLFVILWSQSHSSIILIEESSIVAGDPHISRSSALRVLKALAQYFIDVAGESSLDTEAQAHRVNQIADL
jgi:hypothetical protein